MVSQLTEIMKRVFKDTSQYYRAVLSLTHLFIFSTFPLNTFHLSHAMLWAIGSASPMIN